MKDMSSIWRLVARLSAAILSVATSEMLMKSRFRSARKLAGRLKGNSSRGMNATTEDGADEQGADIPLSKDSKE